MSRVVFEWNVDVEFPYISYNSVGTVPLNFRRISLELALSTLRTLRSVLSFANSHILPDLANYVVPEALPASYH